MTNISEIFLPIKGFEGYYEISNLGRVKSVDRVVLFSDGRKRKYKSRFIKYKTNLPYLIAPLIISQKQKFIPVHRLIAIHFIPNPDNKPFINHKDCNKRNNSLDNLEWCSHAENTEHAVSNSLFKKGENHGNSKLSNSAAMYIKTSKESGVYLSKKFNLATSTISMIRNGKLRKP